MSPESEGNEIADTSRDAQQEPTNGVAPKTFDFGHLSGGGAEVWIELSGITYRLRRTRQGKLILTK